MAKTFTPVHDRVLLRRLQPEPESTTIVIPETVKEKGQEFEVVAASPNWYENGVFVVSNVSPGQKVVLGKYAGIEITLNKEKLLVVRNHDILGFVIDEPS